MVRRLKVSRYRGLGALGLGFQVFKQVMASFEDPFKTLERFGALQVIIYNSHNPL